MSTLGLLAAPGPSTSTGAYGNTPLHLAALRGDEGAVDALLAEGADPNTLNDSGAAPLHYAIMNEHMVNALLARGARPNIVSKIGVSPLMSAAARSDSFAIISRLIAAGADVNVQREKPPEGVGGSALSLAILAGDRRTIDLLLDEKTRVDPKLFGEALATAALEGDLDTTRKLLDHGADPNEGMALPGNALNCAVSSGYIDVAKALIEHGAKLQGKSMRGPGTQAMVFSAYEDGCDPTAARLLVEHGADINTADDSGETALSYALKRGPDSELVRWLKENGAKPSPAHVRTKVVPQNPVPTDSVARAARIREGAQRAVDLMQISSTAFLQNGFVRNQAQCTSCHQQSLPAVAYGWARERGLHIDEHELGRQLVAKVEQRNKQLDRALQLMQPTGGAAIPLGYDAEESYALHSDRTETTEAMSYYLIGTQRADGSWPTQVKRMPMTDGPIIATAWACRALQLYPPAGRQRDADDALRRARSWFAQQQASTLNQRIFLLLGLSWANETTERMRPFADALIKEQRADGGWAQLAGLPCDAWATGSALIALYKAGVTTSDAPYQHGVDFLLRTQFDDGSWWVRSRAWPFQPHFNAKFPHGKDQWISAAGTAWATMALLLTLEPTVDPTTLPPSEKLIAAFQKSAAEESHQSVTQAQAASTAATTVDFARDIQPLLDRSCVKCHSGARPKGSFDLTTRDSLLKGGQSGEPAIVPGYADDSPLIQQVTGQVEDLEMPPLSRRAKFPELSPDEIERLRVWIDAGAPWPSAAVKAAHVSEQAREAGAGGDKIAQSAAAAHEAND